MTADIPPDEPYGRPASALPDPPYTTRRGLIWYRVRMVAIFYMLAGGLTVLFMLLANLLMWWVAG